MKHLGLSQQERDLLDQNRRARNCFLALTALGMVAVALLWWLDAPI